MTSLAQPSLADPMVPSRDRPGRKEAAVGSRLRARPKVLYGPAPTDPPLRRRLDGPVPEAQAQAPEDKDT